MKCLNSASSDNWLSKSGYGIICGFRGALPPVEGCRRYHIPKNATVQISLCHTIFDCLPSCDEMLLYLTDWPIYKPGEMAVWSRIRQSFGCHERLIDSPGHLLFAEDRTSGLSAGLCSLVMLSVWEGFLALPSMSGIVFGDAWIELFSENKDLSQEFAAMMESYNLREFEGHW